ncbi:unnamed protein product [Candida verbasci]|uniref:Uncharacterized protein n=1 Tax=Candida verbasci TaxID=1227364 RepID=A0A9W4TTQ0_9ASCO|nr:unnamed protein product [Candida verbasci]
MSTLHSNPIIPRLGPNNNITSTTPIENHSLIHDPHNNFPPIAPNQTNNQNNNNNNNNNNGSTGTYQSPYPTENTPADVQESLRLIEDLKFFLATAPANWQENQVIRRYYLNNDEGFVSCVFWNNLYFITGTDIVRCIVYKFEHFGRKIIDRKKFEEGIFSDLRNLKCGIDSVLEPPRSEFLEFLFRNSCLRTQKKQKVFFWFNVPHNKLMADALERDLKKERQGQKPTTIAAREPALSFQYDENSNLFNQLAKYMETKKKINDSYVFELSPDNNAIPTTTTRRPNGPLPTAESPLKPTKRGRKSIKKSQPNEDDEEDDFPLDYFDTHQPNQNYYQEEYATSYHNNYLDDNYDNFIDASTLFQHSNTNQVVFNDDYLIEQAQPIKTPLTSTVPNTKPTKLTIRNNEEVYLPHPHQQPLYNKLFPPSYIRVTNPPLASEPYQASSNLKPILHNPTQVQQQQQLQPLPPPPPPPPGFYDSNQSYESSSYYYNRPEVDYRQPGFQPPQPKNIPMANSYSPTQTNQQSIQAMYHLSSQTTPKSSDGSQSRQRELQSTIQFRSTTPQKISNSLKKKRSTQSIKGGINKKTSEKEKKKTTPSTEKLLNTKASKIAVNKDDQ